MRESLLGQSDRSWGLNNLLEAGTGALEPVRSEPYGSSEFCCVLLLLKVEGKALSKDLYLAALHELFLSLHFNA